MFMDEILHILGSPSALAATHLVLQSSTVRGVDLKGSPHHDNAIMTWHVVCGRVCMIFLAFAARDTISFYIVFDIASEHTDTLHRST